MGKLQTILDIVQTMAVVMIAVSALVLAINFTIIIQAIWG